MENNMGHKFVKFVKRLVFTFITVMFLLLRYETIIIIIIEFYIEILLLLIFVLNYAIRLQNCIHLWEI